MTPTVLYNGMIAPLLPYAIRGVIWYQGEANVRRERQYRSLFPATIADWRQAWGTDLPFLFVQIAPFREMTPELREAQLLTWQHTPKTAMVVTTDCGDANDIHPPHKQVGRRAAGAGGPGAGLRREARILRPGLRRDQGQGRQGDADLHAHGRRAGRQGWSAQGLRGRRRRRRVSSGPRRDPRQDGGRDQRSRPAAGRRPLRLGQRPRRQPVQQGRPPRVTVPDRYQLSGLPVTSRRRWCRLLPSPRLNHLFQNSRRTNDGCVLIYSGSGR